MSNVIINGNVGYNSNVSVNGLLGVSNGTVDVGQTLSVSQAGYIGYGVPSNGKVTVSSATAIGIPGPHSESGGGHYPEVGCCFGALIVLPSTGVATTAQTGDRGEHGYAASREGIFRWLER
jgi:hypothetical protein